ncbi:MAG: DEAD/DEAH box helicase, partial [Acidimicrobiales bacterium]
MGPDSVADALARVVAGLPGGGEARPGQAAMAEAVAQAISTKRHLVVQAGTGTGKSLAYLVPAILSGSKVVVATATLTLQDQLAHKDLPPLECDWAVLKGRGNYLCRQKASEIAGGASGAQLQLEDTGSGSAGQVRRLIAWGEVTTTGDRAELAFEPTPRAWG